VPIYAIVTSDCGTSWTRLTTFDYTGWSSPFWLWWEDRMPANACWS